MVWIVLEMFLKNRTSQSLSFINEHCKIFKRDHCGTYVIFSWMLSFKNLFSDRPEYHALLSRARIYSSHSPQKETSVSSISVLP